MRFVQNNTIPISYVVATTCIGYLIGYTVIGLVIGTLTVCMANLFSYTGWVK
jgi:hypothetical protein